MPARGPGGRLAPGERPTRSRWPLHAWEPVIYYGGRQLVTGRRRADSPVCGVGPLDTLPGDRGQARGGVPVDLHPARRAPGDTLDDLFPGSGAVGRARAAFTRSPAPALLAVTNTSPAAATDASWKARADASFPAASGGSYPSSEASHDAYPSFPAACTASAPGTFRPRRWFLCAAPPSD